MEKFIKSCKNESARSRQMNADTERHGNVEVPTGTLEKAGAFDLIQDHGEANTYQLLETSTPKRNAADLPTSAVERDTGGQEVSVGNGPLPEEGAPDRDEIAELCLPESPPIPGDGAGAGDQNEEAQSEAGDLLEEDVLASKRLSAEEDMLSSINYALDKSLENTASIDKLKGAHIEQCVKSGLQHSKSMDEIEMLKYRVGCLFRKDFLKDERITALEADKKMANRGVEIWRILFDDLKKNGHSSKVVQTPTGGSFQAKLYLNGVKKQRVTRSACLSLVVSETSESSAAVAVADKALKYTCRVQLVNLGNVADSIQEEHDLQRGVIGATLGKNQEEFLTLVPVKLLEDPSQQFVMNGVLVIILTFKEIQTR